MPNFSKKELKYLANADKKFQEEQLQAATAAEQLTKAIATVEQYRDELTDGQYADVTAKFEEQKKEIETFLLKSRDKYVAKLKELGDPRIDPETGELL